MGKKLYVGNLSFSMTEDSLTEYFSQCGTVDSAKLITDRDTGRSKGFAFIEMSTNDEAQKAIETLDGQEYDGRTMRVNEAKPQENRPQNNSGFGGRRSRY